MNRKVNTILCPGDHFHHVDCRLIYEGGATTIADVLMVMAARDRPSAAESDFLCRHT